MHVGINYGGWGGGLMKGSSGALEPHDLLHGGGDTLGEGENLTLEVDDEGI